MIYVFSSKKMNSFILNNIDSHSLTCSNYANLDNQRD